MKYFLYIFSIILFLFTPNENLAQNDQPKIGLVLSGGGARGFAHIGTLKLIDSLQIPIDYIVGTSMGGIIGGLYASGYTGNEIEKHVLASDWVELLGDELPRSETPYLEKKDDGAFFVELGLEDFKPILPSGFVSGQLASLLLADLTSGVGTIRDFNNLPIPFKCVAVDLVTGSEVVLENGSLSKAMRATMSLPSIFSPVEWGDSLLVDGGMLNNFPADVLKEMGADVIIGVNIGSQLAPKEELNNLVDILSQTMVLTDVAKQRRNYELCDLIIIPDLGEFTTMDFGAEEVNSIIQIGIEAASNNKNQLLELKQKYVYNVSENSIEDIYSTEQIISAITISGETSYNLEYLYELIGHSPSDTLDIIMLKDNISKMKTSGLFKDVKYEIQRINKNNINLNFKLTEKKQPLIFGFTIIGNENLGFDFILDLLGAKAGDPFNKKHLNNQIKYMSGLGYFETITYIIEPVRDNYLRIILTVKEKPVRELRFGYRYDDQYKFVGFIGIQITNFPFVGLREELLLQFAGLVKFDYSVLFPSQTLDLPIFPYIRFGYKNIPLDIYDLNGDKLAEYNDKSLTFGVGIGHVFNNIGAIRLEYNHEYTNMNPELVGVDSANILGTWKDELHVLHADLSFDLLDDSVLPRSGFWLKANYDLSLINIGSALKYGYFSVDGKLIKTIFRRHTFTLAGFYTDSFNNLPYYKWSQKGGANSFVGMKNNQVIGTNYGYLRFDYRYEFINNVFLKVIANAGVYNLVDIVTVEDNFYGYGFGIKVNSVIGPLELLFSRGSKSVSFPNEFQSVVYFNAGFSF